MERLLIVADDFAGAADCAIAFAQRGYATAAVLEARDVAFGDLDVLAVDTDTRDCEPEAAGQRVRELLQGAPRHSTVFKKVDSTLRGNPAAELDAILTGRSYGCVIAAPAFPATGRTTLDGRQHLDGRRLEETEFAGQVSSSRVSELLAEVGLPVVEVGLEGVRSGEVARLPRSAGRSLLICDAETDDDLAGIVRDGLDSELDVVWWGSAGLAHRLAAALPGRSFRAGSGDPASPDIGAYGAGPVLLVVGSPAAATRAQLERLRQASGLAEIELHGSGSAVDIDESVDALRARLRAGCDCILTLAGESGDRDHGRPGTRRLASVAAAVSELVGGVVLTGGETARAVLEELSVTGLRLRRELAPGIPLGHTTDRRALPVAIKAGGFGDADALVGCRDALRAPADVAQITEVAR